MLKKHQLFLPPMISILTIALTLVTASPASADPTSTPSSTATSVAKSPMTRDEALSAIVRSNPKAHRIRSDAVNVAPGIDVIYGRAPANTKGEAPAAVKQDPPYSYACYPYYLCVWADTLNDGFGYGLAFYYCQGPDGLVDLNTMRYPDGAVVGNGPTKQRWNDKISAYENSQTQGTVSYFYDWIGYWQVRFGAQAFSADYNLVDDGLNDIIDAVHVC